MVLWVVFYKILPPTEKDLYVYAQFNIKFIV